MSEKTLTTPYTLPSGVVMPNRFAMAPMIVFGSEPGGHVGQEDLDYFARRTGVAGMLITGAMAVTRAGRGVPNSIVNEDDSVLPGLTSLATTMKKDGNLAVAQLYHSGREAGAAVEELGRAIAPSTVEFDWLPYVPQEMTEAEIAETITAFGAATQRAIDAGFDGVEIHGANHYLLQQFFSAYANRRTDAWGGTLEKRMAFPLAVLDEVKRVAATAGRPFAVGYRLCAEEIHGENVGYRIDESSVLVEAIAARGVDYIHISLFTGYAAGAEGATASYGQVFRDVIGGRCPLMIVSDVFTLYDATLALEHGDLVAIGRAALIEPEFAAKIVAGRADEIETNVKGRWEDLDLPVGLRVGYAGPFRTVLPPMPGIDEYIIEN